jgi:hypothetical protein
VVFKDCVYTAADHAGFYFGLASIACWLVAQVPQFVQNFRLKSAEGLSPWWGRVQLEYPIQMTHGCESARFHITEPMMNHEVKTWLPGFNSIKPLLSNSTCAATPWFLAEWLMGDTFNLLGCLMTGDQLPSETYTAGALQSSTYYRLT